MNKHLDLLVNLAVIAAIVLSATAALMPSERELPREDIFEAYARGFALGFADGRDSVAVVAVES